MEIIHAFTDEIKQNLAMNLIVFLFRSLTK